MSDNLANSGGATPQAGSAGEGSKGENNDRAGSAGDQSFSPEYVKRLQTDFFKTKEELKSIREEFETNNRKKLEDENKFRELYEIERQEKQKLAQTVTGFQEEKIQSVKLAEVTKHLLGLGLDPVKQSRALRLLDVSGVVYDDATKSVIGADRVAQKFYEENNDLGFFKAAQGKVDQRAGTTHAGSVDLDKMTKQEKLTAASNKQW